MTVQTANRSLSWRAIKGRIPIEAVAVSLLREPEGRSGSRGLWWNCPFHEDRNPSFNVDPERSRWKCFAGCGSGDSADLVARLGNLTFPQAVEHLASMFSLEGRGRLQAPASLAFHAPPRTKAEPPAADPVKALALRQWATGTALEAVERLWGPEGREALDYLRGRGLTDATIGLARLGFVKRLAAPKKDGSGVFTVAGLSVPWFDGGRLALLKVRRLDGRKPKYIDVYRDRPAVYAPRGVRDGFPLVLVEGEFDALLLDQELRDHADVVTLGSASGKLNQKANPSFKGASRVFIATDGDAAGRKAARRLLTIFPGAERVRPPAPAKDWGDLHAGGFGRIACHWGRFLPLGSPPRAEDFFDASLYSLPANERDRIEATEEREAIQGEPRLSDMEPELERRPLSQGVFEPIADDEAARLALAAEGETESEIEALDRLMASIPHGGFTRVDPAELERFVEFDPPAVDRPKPIEEPAAPRGRPRRIRAEAMDPVLL